MPKVDREAAEQLIERLNRDADHDHIRTSVRDALVFLLNAYGERLENERSDP